MTVWRVVMISQPWNLYNDVSRNSPVAIEGISATAFDRSRCVRGWIGYFGLAQQIDLFANLDGWIRRRIRMCYWKQWRRPRTKVRNLVRWGASEDGDPARDQSQKLLASLADTSDANCDAKQMAGNLGLLSLKQLWCDIAPLRGTAECGHACQVVRGGPSAMAAHTRFRQPVGIGNGSSSARESWIVPHDQSNHHSTTCPGSVRSISNTSAQSAT